MPPAKLSGALLVRKDARVATTPAEDLGAATHDPDAKTIGGPVLVWSAPLESVAEPTTDRDPARATHRAAGGTPAPRRTVLPALALAVSVLAIGCVGGPLFLRPNVVGLSTETAPSVAPSKASEKLASPSIELEAQPPVITATAASSLTPPDSAAANAVVAAATPARELPDHPLTDEPGTPRVVALSDPAVSDADSPTAPEAPRPTPGANLSAGTANSSATPTELLGSAELNSAFLARGDSLFVVGDLSSARMLYERAATAGQGQAALRLGETYDPAFLARTRFIGARANAATAAYWYQRARELGTPGADILLAAIAAETDHSSR
jgi:hypothetical protein